MYKFALILLIRGYIYYRVSDIRLIIQLRFHILDFSVVCSDFFNATRVIVQ